MNKYHRLHILVLLASLIFVPLYLAAETVLKIGFLRVDCPEMLPISRFELKPDDLGEIGAKLGLEDNNTTGAFLGQSYELVEAVTDAGNVTQVALDLVEMGAGAIIVHANSKELQAVLDAVPEDRLVFNVAAPDNALRGEACRENLLHILPSRAMKADAVAQYLVAKRWDKWVLVHGSNASDLALAQAYREAGEKFGASVQSEVVFEDTGSARRTDSGHTAVSRILPVLTQDLPEHDVVIAVDESDIFAAYLPYNLWEPRPTVGSAGLRPLSWHGAHEAWGATQLQRRFEENAGRYMTESDYNSWLAVRVLGEAVTRTNTNDIAALREYILSDAFEIAGFKGFALTFRPWNGQLRQPVFLADGRITQSVSPQDGFLHPSSPLDTLGVDAPQSVCDAFN